MTNSAHDILWRRMKYALTPQHDIYQSLRERLMGASVLEVGFGTGAGVLQYAMAAKQVDAIEIDSGAVHFAQEIFPLSNVRWIEADITSSDWWTMRRRREWNNESYYDYVIMVETLEHIDDWKAAISHVNILLKPGGYLIMSARNANADLRRWKDLHEREWTGKEVLDSLGEFFPSVYLYNWNLQEQQDPDTTRLTPLIAIAKKSV